MEPKGECQDKQGEIPLEEQVAGENKIGGKMELERTTLKSSHPRAGTGVEHPNSHVSRAGRCDQQLSVVVCTPTAEAPNRGKTSIQAIVGETPNKTPKLATSCQIVTV